MQTEIVAKISHTPYRTNVTICRQSFLLQQNFQKKNKKIIV